MPDFDPSSAQLWKVFPPICQLFLCKNDFATALAIALLWGTLGIASMASSVIGGAGLLLLRKETICGI